MREIPCLNIYSFYFARLKNFKIYLIGVYMSEEIQIRLRNMYVSALRLHLKPLDLPGDKLIETLSIDSIKAMELFVNIETIFGVVYDPDKMPVEILDSFERLAKYLTENA